MCAAYTLVVIRDIPKGNQDFGSQLRRAVTSIAVNIAEAVWKTGKDDQKRLFFIARGSATKSATWYDILKVAGLVTEAQSKKAKDDL